MSVVLETRHRKRKGCPICELFCDDLDRAHALALAMNEPEPEEGGAGFELLEAEPLD